MKCENRYCIYQETGLCMLTEISVDSLGQCNDCITVALSDEELVYRKHLQRGEECE